MDKQLITSVFIVTIVAMTIFHNAYGQPNFGYNTYDFTQDHWNRLVSMNGSMYSFKCPDYYDPATAAENPFTINMSEVTSNSFFEGYEMAACSGKSADELFSEIGRNLGNMITIMEGKTLSP